MITTYPLIIDRRDTHLTYRDNQLHIKSDHTRQSIPINMLNLVIIAATTHTTTNVLRQLAEQGITTLILPPRGKGEPAWITPGLTCNPELRRLQYLHAHRPQLAWFWIERKIIAQKLTLQLLELDATPLHRLIQPPATFDHQAILGREGSAARHYFNQLTNMLPPEWNFTGRNRNPPRDPFNALLSLSYTLLTTEALHVCHSIGFDPWQGFLHQPYPARPALALDLIEPFRPQIDLWCLQLAHDILAPHKHFTQNKETGGWLLNKQGRNLYFQQWAIDRQNWYQDKSLMQNLLNQLHEFKQTLKSLDTSTQNSSIKDQTAP